MAESMIYGSGKVSRSEAKVSKFGDNMYGHLNFVQNLTDGVVPDSNTWGNAAPRFYDSEGVNIGYLDQYFRTNGNQELHLYARRIINGVSKGNYFGIGVDPSGNPNYIIYDPDAFREALGLAYKTVYSSLAALVTAISNLPSATVNIFFCGTAIQLFNATSSYNAIAIVAKVSANNAYYLAYNRDKCAIGNISLANGTINVKHSIV